MDKLSRIIQLNALETGGKACLLTLLLSMYSVLSTLTVHSKIATCCQCLNVVKSSPCTILCVSMQAKTSVEHA